MVEAPQPDRVDVNALIDNALLGPRQIGVTAICLLAMITEGYDTYSVSYVGPQIAQLWEIPSEKLGFLLSAVLIGAAVGYLIGGALADRIGRRVPIIIGAVCYGVLSLLTATSGSADIFIVWRFLTGVALGFALPNIVSLSAEYAPARHRSLSVVILYAGAGVGASLGGLIAGALVPLFDWRMVFYLGGIVPLALAALMIFVLPESIRFLALRDGTEARIRPLLSRVTDIGRIPSDARFFLKGERLSRLPVGELFKHGRAAATLLVWLTLTADGGVVVIIAFWLPSLLVDAGQTQAHAIEMTTMTAMGGIFGAPAIGWMMDRFGPYRVLIPAHLLAVLLILVMVWTLDTPSLALGLVYGMAMNGGISGLQGLIASVYPTSIRGTGVGWAVAVGRVTGIAAPTIIGFSRAADFAPKTNLYGCGILIAIAVAALYFLSRNRYGRPVGAS
jgi:MFS transporter, AAHS family, 4-hydroxybenzoate transporter